MAKKQEPLGQGERRVSPEQRLKFVNIHLSDQVIRLEKELAQVTQVNAQLRSELAQFKQAMHTQESDAFFAEMGIKKGDLIEIGPDGTLKITPQQGQELFPPKPKADQNGGSKPAPKKPEAVPTASE